MFKLIDEWREGRRFRAVYQQLLEMSDHDFKHAGIQSDDLAALGRGKNPWGHHGGVFP
jgi:uncharacterized protein YjiS (DUF1127 family)